MFSEQKHVNLARSAIITTACTCARRCSMFEKNESMLSRGVVVCFDLCYKIKYLLFDA